MRLIRRLLGMTRITNASYSFEINKTKTCLHGKQMSSVAERTVNFNRKRIYSKIRKDWFQGKRKLFSLWTTDTDANTDSDSNSCNRKCHSDRCTHTYTTADCVIGDVTLDIINRCIYECKGTFECPCEKVIKLLNTAEEFLKIWRLCHFVIGFLAVF